MFFKTVQTTDGNLSDEVSKVSILLINDDLNIR